jgi:flotillin
MELVFILVGIAAVAVIVTLKNIVNLWCICGPNEVLIFSGVRRRTQEGKPVGYDLVRGGGKLRIPLFMEVDSLDLTNMIIDLKIEGAYSKGGIPLNVNGVANIKVASDEPLIGNAIERFLKKKRGEIMRIAQETLEGNLRGVLATLTPEEVNQDRVKFEQSLLHEGGRDLEKLGLVLDTLKIQHLSDDKGYLDSIGRKQTAEIQKKSRIAEAENKALATIRDAKNEEEKAIARINAQIDIARAEAQRRIIDAQTRKGAMIAEEKSHVTAAIAKAQAELEVQQARLDQVKLRLTADKIKPAEAHKAEQIAAARGAAAKIVEEGRATASSLREMASAWNFAGPSAREIFLAQKLESLVGIMTGTIGKLEIEKVTMIDSAVLGAQNGNGSAVRAAIASEQTKQMLGLDVPALLQGLVAARPAPASQA